MTITEFIQDRVLLERLQQTRVLVVYDRERRYRALCLALAAERRRVIDASDGSIESREAALTTLQHMGSVQPPVEQMLIYVPAEAPLTEEQMQRDPFAVYTEIGSCFPDPLKSGDEYQALCLRFKPDHATAIRSLFQQNPNPDFAMIDAIGAGSGWPQLQAHLGVESARAILLALLAPSEPQKKALKAKAGWWGEAKALLHTALGLQLLTRVQGWETLADELWRYLLFSEFVFDLPEGAALPATLESVPRAPTAARAWSRTCAKVCAATSVPKAVTSIAPLRSRGVKTSICRTAAAPSMTWGYAIRFPLRSAHSLPRPLLPWPMATAIANASW